MRPRLASLLRRLTLRQRIAVTLAGTLALTTLCVETVWEVLDQLTASHAKVTMLGHATRLHQDADMMHDALRADVFAALMAADTPDPADDEQPQLDLARHRAAARDDLRALAELPLQGSIASAVAEGGAGLQAFADHAEGLGRLVHDDPEAARAGLPAFLEEFSAVEAALDAVTQNVLEAARAEEAARLEAANADAYAQVAWRAFAAVGLASVVFVGIAMDLLGSLERVRVVAARLACGEFSARNDDYAQDELGDIARSFDDLGTSLQEMVGRMDGESRRSRFGTQLVEALEMVDQEETAIEVVERAMVEVSANRPMELLLADSSRAHLRSAAVNPAAGAAGCGVQSPWECVAVRRAAPMHFPTSEALNACPRLRGRVGGDCSATCVPVSFMGKAIGVLHTTAPEHTPVSEEEDYRIRTLAAQAGARIGTLRVLQRTQLQASTDGLTGLVNRRTLEERVRDLLRSQSSFAVVMADLDHFKTLNDTFGHEAGDKALRHFSTVVRANLRPHDVPCRFGGEEFVFVLPGCDAETAAAAMERLRGALGESFNGTGPTYSASFGVADSADGTDLESILRVADAAVYSAKQLGRDRVVIGEPGGGMHRPLRAAG